MSVNVSESIKNKIQTIHESKQSNVVVSIDLIDPTEILALIGCIGRDVMGIKLHSDIIGFNDIGLEEFYLTLKELKEKHNFIIIEDRKFCDIGNTVKMQSKNLDYSDLITVHSLPGEGIIAGLRDNCKRQNVGILLIAEMSSSRNLITSDYTKNTIEMAENNRDVVVGFICQNKLASDFLHFSPGVKLQNAEKMTDNLGQSYTSPHTLKKRGIDYMIIGRGITDSKIPNVMIKLYQQDYDDTKVDVNFQDIFLHLNSELHVLKQSIIEKGIIKRGNFILSSGEQSSVYADFRLLTGYPHLMLKVAHEFSRVCNKRGLTPENSVLMGIPMGGIALSSSISFVSNIPMAIVREKRKEYGSKNLVEGMNVDDVKKRHVILIEDVITTGNSVAKTINMLNKEEDIVVDYVLCILDREKGGKKLLEDEYDVCVDSLYLLSELNK